ncbi:MAG: hypothetical protein GWP19_01775 [Planctomycetia bacterium]|nr:hypothetical protein [Planctomycetia bacterium]
MSGKGSHRADKKKREIFRKQYPSGRKWFSAVKGLEKAIKECRPQKMINDLKKKLEKYE